ncbi:hypothetical protein Leryth_001760 [Lithospermum erythrorhizon]|nr:hypothetical protein Leryth_001760 [Lithospermum erythrorhizon]
MEKEKSFRGVTFDRHPTFHGHIERQQSFHGGLMEKQKSFKGLMDKQKSFKGLIEKQKSFRISMERQMSFGGDRKRGKDSPGKKGDSQLHLAARAGNLTKVKDMFHKFTSDVIREMLSKQNQEGETPLYISAENGHADIVEEFLKHLDVESASIAATNGYDPFHIAARQGHCDKKGQTALHMAVKGQNVEIVLELIKPDSSVLGLGDNKGNTALHIATRKGRTQIVQCLISVEGVDLNVVNKAGETSLDIADKFGTPELASILKDAGALHSKDHGKPPSAAKQLKQTVSDIRHDVESQLKHTRQTGFKVQKIAKKVKKLHISGLNNAINSATVVAVLIATVAFAAIFTVPGQYVEDRNDKLTLGQAHIATNAAFIIFFLSDSVALFISLAVVVVQTSIVVIEQKEKKQLMFVINKLMWMACLSISVAFISLTYIVVGPHERWLAFCTTILGSTIMLTTIGSMCYCVIRHRMEDSKLRRIRRAETLSRSFSMSVASDSEIYNGSYNRKMYAV